MTAEATAMHRWVLPVPVPPMKIALRLASRKPPEARTSRSSVCGHCPRGTRESEDSHQVCVKLILRKRRHPLAQARCASNRKWKAAPRDCPHCVANQPDCCCAAVPATLPLQLDPSLGPVTNHAPSRHDPC